jgi:hypothetical protein
MATAQEIIRTSRAVIEAGVGLGSERYRQLGMTSLSTEIIPETASEEAAVEPTPTD